MIGFHWNGWTKHPEGAFTCVDPGLVAIECEYLELVYGLVRAAKPARLLETGSGISTSVLLAACRANGRGVVTTCDLAPRVQPEAGLVIAEGASLDYLATVSRGYFDFALLDSSEPSKVDELAWCLAHLAPRSLICLHDTGEKHYGNPAVDPFLRAVADQLRGYHDDDGEVLTLIKNRGLTVVQTP